MEQVDMQDLKSCGSNAVRVRFPSLILRFCSSVGQSNCLLSSRSLVRIQTESLCWFSVESESTEQNPFHTPLMIWANRGKQMTAWKDMHNGRWRKGQRRTLIQSRLWVQIPSCQQMRSETFQSVLDQMKKEHWSVKLKRWFRIELYVIKCLVIKKYIKRKLYGK